MTNQQLHKVLLGYAKECNCFTQEVRNLLLDYKKQGIQQDTIIQLLNTIKNEHPTNQTLQDGADDILDIVTGYCSAEMRVWE